MSEEMFRWFVIDIDMGVFVLNKVNSGYNFTGCLSRFLDFPVGRLVLFDPEQVCDTSLYA
jgi:hypothetical protein